MTDRFICPKDGEPCQFYNACASRQEELSGGIEPDSVLDKFLRRLNYDDPRLAEAEVASYCINERMEAFRKVVVSPESSSEAKQMAMERVLQLGLVRNQFIGEGSVEAEVA